VGRARSNGITPEYEEIGDRLRAARGERGLSLRGLAEQLGVSPSLISQVERGRAKPSVNTLYAMARVLDISLDELLFIDARPTSGGMTIPLDALRPNERNPFAPSAPVQTAEGRKSIRLASGVTWERLTTESIPNVDFLYVTYEVGGASSPEDEFQRHAGNEWGYVLSGRLGVMIGFDDHVLQPGDAVALDSSMPHRLYNAGDEPVHAIWFVLGRRSVDAGRG
jgi:transcriptional regulator with XRE-family HTH domain